MRWQPWFAAVLVGLGVASCGENAPPSTRSQPTLSEAATAGSAPAAAQPSAAQQPSVHQPPAHQSAAARAPRPAAPVPPDDAQWTIYCDQVDGPGHIENAGILKSRLIALSGMPDWYVVHDDKESMLYYGYYRALDIPGERARAEQDRLKIAGLTDRVGNRVIRGGVLVPVNAPDPQAPADWNLLNAPKNAYWTMEIATFSGNQKRKEAAVQAVRELRDKGEPAFYYHGPSSSSVCVGAWPRDAVLEQGTGVDKTGKTRDDAHSVDPSQSIFVFGGYDPAPKNVAGQVLEPGTGKPMSVQGNKLEIQSDDMKKRIAEFPYHYVNYELHAAQSGNQQFPDPSVLVVIPRAQSTATEDDWRLTGGSQSVPDAAQPRQPSAAGDNVLRSIGDK